MESSKWIATVASIWIQCGSGASYVFGVYSPILKSSQNYDQTTLDSVAVFKDIGANIGVFAGLLYSAVVTASSSSHRNSKTSTSTSSIIKSISGPWIVITIGAIQCFIGYFFMWLAVTGRIPRPPVPLMCLFMFLASHAVTFFNTANVVTAVQNFPDYSGTIVGIIKGFVGLSGAILIQIYQTIYHDKPSSFLLMLSLLPPLVSVLLMPFIKINATRGADEKKHLNAFSLIAVLIAAYLMILIILESIVTIGFYTRIVTFCILLFGLASPTGIAVKAHIKDTLNLSSSSSSIDESPLLIDHHESEVGKIFEKQNHPQNGVVDQESPSSQDKRMRTQLLEPEVTNLNILQAMKTVEFWLLFLAMVCGLGSGMATVNNISQIGGSLHYTRVETTTLVSLWSIWNFLGRFGAGFISDYFLHLKGWARPIFMAITLATMGIGHLIIASGLPGALYAGSIVVGVCYGSQWSLMPTIASEIFGVAHLGTIFNSIAIASPIGSSILSVRVVGFFYDKEAALDHSGNTCFGSQCFMVSFIIMAVVSTFGFVFSLALFFRTRRFYREVIFERILQHTVKQ